jgi:hypothetical protein
VSVQLTPLLRRLSFVKRPHLQAKPACGNIKAMPDRLKPALGLTASLAVLLLSGCGSAGTQAPTVSAPNSTATTTKAHFIAQAEGICRTLSAQEKPLRAQQESLKRLPTAAAGSAFVSLVRRVVVISDAANSKLHALPQPPGDAQAIDKLLTGFSEEAAEVSSIADAAAGQESTVGEAAEGALKRSIADNSGLADAYGMKECIGSE